MVKLMHGFLSVDSGLRESAEHLLLGRVRHHVGQQEHLASVVADVDFVLGDVPVEKGRVQAAVRQFLDEWKALDAFEDLG